MYSFCSDMLFINICPEADVASVHHQNVVCEKLHYLKLFKISLKRIVEEKVRMALSRKQKFIRVITVCNNYGYCLATWYGRAIQYGLECFIAIL